MSESPVPQSVRPSGFSQMTCFGVLGDARQDVGARVGAVAAAVAEDDDGGAAVEDRQPARLEVGQRSAVVGGAEADARP